MWFVSHRICPLCPLNFAPLNRTRVRWTFASENQPPMTLIVAQTRSHKQRKQIGKIAANAEGCWSIQFWRFMLAG